MRKECEQHYTPARDNQYRSTARYYADNCPYCEIDRLTAQLAEANERCRLLDEKAGDWQHKYAQETMRLQSQLAERDAEITRIRNAFGDKSKENSVLKGALHSAGKAFSRENYHVLTQAELDRKLLDHTALLSAKLASSQQEVERLKESEEVLTDCLNGSSKAMYTAEMYDKLRTENAALREEVGRLKEIGNRRLMHCNQCGSDLIVDICSAGKSIHTTDIRKHTAREILQLLDNADWACSTYEETYYQAVCAIKSKFGLEG